MDESVMRNKSNYEMTASSRPILGEESQEPTNVIETLMQQWRPKRSKEEERSSLIAQYFEQMATFFPDKYGPDGLIPIREPIRLTDGEAAVERAAYELWPNAIPPRGLRAKVRDVEIQNKLVELGLHAESPATIRRAFAKMREAVSRVERN